MMVRERGRTYPIGLYLYYHHDNPYYNEYHHRHPVR